MYKILLIIIIIFFILTLSYNLRKETLNTCELLNNFRNNDKALVLLILGQSNAANYASKLFSTKNKIYTFYDNEVAQAKDPLKGASGTKGNIWIPFSNEL